MSSGLRSNETGWWNAGGSGYYDPAQDFNSDGRLGLGDTWGGQSLYSEGIPTMVNALNGVVNEPRSQAAGAPSAPSPSASSLGPTPPNPLQGAQQVSLPPETLQMQWMHANGMLPGAAGGDGGGDPLDALLALYRVK